MSLLAQARALFAARFASICDDPAAVVHDNKAATHAMVGDLGVPYAELHRFAVQRALGIVESSAGAVDAVSLMAALWEDGLVHGHLIHLAARRDRQAAA